MKNNKADHPGSELVDVGPAEESTAPPADETATADAAKTGVSVETSEQLTPQHIAALKDQAGKAQHYYDQLLRTTADFENFRKRTVRERSEAVRYANEALLQKLLPVLDTFDMAMSAADTSTATVQVLKDGVSMIHQQLKSTLAGEGLEEIDALRQPFDPNRHEAMMQEESAEVSEGSVVRQLRKGYKLRDRLLRPASVVVAKPVSGAKAPEPVGS